MTDGLSFTLTLGCVLAAVPVLVAALSGRYRWSSTWPLLALVELGLVVQLGLDVARLVGGHRPGEYAVHLAYAVTSVLVLPAAATQAAPRTDPAEDGDRWAGVLVVVALATTAVIVIRMQTTYRT